MIFVHLLIILSGQNLEATCLMHGSGFEQSYESVCMDSQVEIFHSVSSGRRCPEDLREHSPLFSGRKYLKRAH